MAKKRSSHLLLSLASGALASAALLPGCSGTESSSTPDTGGGSGGSGDTAGGSVGTAGGSGGTAAAPCTAAHPCGLVVNPNGGSGGGGTVGLVVMPPAAGAGGAGGTTIVTGLVIQPGEAGATGEGGASQGGTGPCGGHFCGSVVAPGGAAGTAGAKP